jgi:hypothetical protein
MKLLGIVIGCCKEARARLCDVLWFGRILDLSASTPLINTLL